MPIIPGAVSGLRRKWPNCCPVGHLREGFDLYNYWLQRCSGSTALNRMLYADTRFYLPNDMLVKVDRMTMAHGLEARTPFLDHNLVELAARFPDSWKLKGFGLEKIPAPSALKR